MRLCCAEVSILWFLWATCVTQAQTFSGACPDRKSTEQIDREIDGLITSMTPAERIEQLRDRAPEIPQHVFAKCDLEFAPGRSQFAPWL